MLAASLSRLVGLDILSLREHMVISGDIVTSTIFRSVCVCVYTLYVHSGSWCLGVEVSDVIKCSQVHRTEVPKKELSALGLKRCIIHG